MMVVVADAILVAGRRAGRLNAPEQTLGDQDGKRVVHRLKRDGADFGPDHLGDAVGGGVRLRRDGPQDRQSLRGDLNPAAAKKICLVGSHACADYIKFWNGSNL
jgi:hypothetical protein